MAPPKKLTLNDAGIATSQELDQIADEFGVFLTAAETTMDNWVASTRGSMMQHIRKTRSELQRLDHSLARLEMLTRSKFGQPDSRLDFDREYAALEGWALTIVANYVALAGLGDKWQKRTRFERATEYVRGAVKLAETHQPVQALAIQQPVLKALSDQSLIFSK